MLVAAVLFTDSFLLSFIQVSISGAILPTQTVCGKCRLHRGCTLSQAKIDRPECSAGLALYSKRNHCSFASQYLASQNLYWLELIDASSTSKRDIVQNSQKLKMTIYIILALLEIHSLHSPCCYFFNSLYANLG